MYLCCRQVYPLDNSEVSAREHRLGIVLVLFAGVCWSLGGVIVRLMDTENAWQILLYRSLFVCLTLWLFLVFRHRRHGSVVRTFQRSGGTAVVAGLGMAVAFIGFIVSLTLTSVANTFFLLATQPFFTAVLAWIVLRERLSPATMVAALTTLAGVAVMFYNGLQIGNLAGNITGLLSAIGFSVFTVSLRSGRHIEMWPAIFYGGLFASLIALVVLLGSGTSIRVSTNDFLWCAVLGVTQIGLGTLAYILGARWVPATELSLLAMTEIVLGPIWAYWVVAEIPTPGTVIGGSMVLLSLAGLATYRLSKSRRGPSNG